MALSNTRARQIGRQMAEGGGGASGDLPVLGSIHLSAQVLTNGSSAGTVIGALTSDNAFASISLADDAGGRVAISGGNLVVGATATSDGVGFNILVRAQIGIIAVEETYEITVEDAPITSITLSAATVTSGSAANTVVGALASVPTGATLTLTNTAGGKFKIVGANLETDAVATDKSVNATETVTVHAVHGTATFDQEFTITVD
jgi:hypothetical protein